MSWWDLEDSMKNAAIRFPELTPRRRLRSDAGSTRLPTPVVEALREILHVHERPPMSNIQRDLAATCRRRRLKMPSRAALYVFLERCPPHEYPIAELPDHVKAALYNLDPDGTVPGHQLAFLCFQHGEPRTLSFAAGLPWLDLYQAGRMRGWRPRSRGLLLAVLRRRGIA